MTERTYVALDLETTGLDSKRDKIIEIGAVRFRGDEILDQFVSFVHPGRQIPLRIQQITGISDADVAAAPVIETVAPELLAFVGRDVHAIIAHNASFDIGFLRAAGIHFHRPAFDTFELATILLPGSSSYSLGELCYAAGIVLTDAHRALSDTLATAKLFQHLWERLRSLPRPLLERIVAAGRSGRGKPGQQQEGKEVDWPLLDLFAHALEQGNLTARTPPTAPTAFSPRVIPSTEEARESTQPDTEKRSMAHHRMIDPMLLESIFADDGLLAQELGDSYEVRPGQQKMARAVLAAFNGEDHLLIEAGTGIGKSLAYLVPAALWSIYNGQPVLIATNTIALQDQLLEKEIPQVSRLMQRLSDATIAKTPLRTSVLKGRTNYLCLRRLYSWQQGRDFTPLELRVLAKVLVWLTITQSGDLGELFLFSDDERAIRGHICSDGTTCTPERCSIRAGRNLLADDRFDFYFAARARARKAHLLIINQALLLADIANESNTLPAYKQLVIDEAHHLEDAATEQLTNVLDWRTIRRLLFQLHADSSLMTAILRTAGRAEQFELGRLVKRVSQQAEQAFDALEEFAERLLAFVTDQREIRPKAGYAQRIHLGRGVRSQPDWSQLEVRWDQVAGIIQDAVTVATMLGDSLEEKGWHKSEPRATLLSELRGGISDLSNIRELLAQIITGSGDSNSGRNRGPEGTASVSWALVNDKSDEVSLYRAPLFVNELIERELIHKKRSVILTGATLRTGAGFEYTQDRLGLWDVPTQVIASPFNYKKSTMLYLPADLPAPNHANYQRSVEQAIIAAAGATAGRTMALFTSYAHLRTTATAIRTPLDRMGITVLQHGDSSRRRLLREFSTTEKAVLLGTRSFWEGIDLPGDQLLSLLIVRLPFAVPNDPLVAARSAEFDNAFYEFTLPDAILRFRQGFGRLIRHSDDRGTVVILDNRVWQKGYGQAFLDSLPACTVRRGPLANLEEEILFWMMQ